MLGKVVLKVSSNTLGERDGVKQTDCHFTSFVDQASGYWSSCLLEALKFTCFEFWHWTDSWALCFLSPSVWALSRSLFQITFHYRQCILHCVFPTDLSPLGVSSFLKLEPFKRRRCLYWRQGNAFAFFSSFIFYPLEFAYLGFDKEREISLMCELSRSFIS